MRPSKPNRYDILPVILILLLAAVPPLVFLRASGKGTAPAKAVITANGAAIGEYSLASLPEGGTTVTVAEEGVTLTVLLERDGVTVTGSDCPGHDCEKTGKIKKAGRSIVCLPGKIMITLTGGQNDGPDLIVK